MLQANNGIRSGLIWLIETDGFPKLLIRGLHIKEVIDKHFHNNQIRFIDWSKLVDHFGVLIGSIAGQSKVQYFCVISEVGLQEAWPCLISVNSLCTAKGITGHQNAISTRRFFGR